MIVGVPGETAPGESRVALVPPVAERFVDRGHEVLVAAGAGTGAGWSDEAYAAVGCALHDRRDAVFEAADVVLQVRALGAAPEGSGESYREGQVVVGLLGPYDVPDRVLEALASRDVSAFALELVPRIARAQAMDVLSSMASVAGYKAVVRAADTLPSLFPMQMTAAGTVTPAEVFVVGAGVAGLQAIATARRLGARVRAYDIRPAVREEVESLGARFLEIEIGEDADLPARETAGGYARAQDETFYERQRAAMTDAVGRADVVVTAAAVPGRRAPTLVSSEMVAGMSPGSVVVDLAADTGGNCEPTVPGETVEREGVTVIGPRNLPSQVPHTASQLFANNVAAFLERLLDEEGLAIDEADEIVDATLLTHGGRVRAPHRRDGDG